MFLYLSENPVELGKRAARVGADRIRQAISARGEAFIILATGASQFDTLENLIIQPGIDWSKVTVFHLDEYIGMPETHAASFRLYLKTRFIDRITDLGAAILVEGDASDLNAELARISATISGCQIDVAFIGIGENSHLAFNDPRQISLPPHPISSLISMKNAAASNSTRVGSPPLTMYQNGQYR